MFTTLKYFLNLKITQIKTANEDKQFIQCQTHKEKKGITYQNNF